MKEEELSGRKPEEYAKEEIGSSNRRFFGNLIPPPRQMMKNLHLNDFVGFFVKPE
jgi:hypothetical protein